MKFKKGMMVKTVGATWYVKEEQNTDKYLKVVSNDGFETIVDITLPDVKIYK